jgi:CDP-glucose 4,6-dehydratase
MTDIGDVYRSRRVVVTGHTGFKGSWLALWLGELGAQVAGIALAPPTTPNHWDVLGLDIPDHRVDIRDTAAVATIVAAIQPEIVFHLAAQPLVRRSYREPVNTWATNVVGTANVLDACRLAGSVRAIVVVTSDKCYENRGPGKGYRESDRLGGHDPYSASKAGAELVAASYRDAYFSAPASTLLATARSGNVIGGGDWAEDRLIPDLIRAQATGASLAIRSPDATRPWQHVLECANGYLQLGAQLLHGRRDFASAWNFGPAEEDNRTVSAVLEALRKHWTDLRWHRAEADSLAEAQWLYLDSSKARSALGWRPVWSLDEALAATASWYRRFLVDGVAESRRQLAQYVAAIPAPTLASTTQ